MLVELYEWSRNAKDRTYNANYFSDQLLRVYERYNQFDSGLSSNGAE